MKRWLVIANDQYYPCSGTDDWHGAYKTIDEARESEAELEAKGKITYIVDLLEWTE